MVVGEKEWGRFAWLRDFLPYSIETHYDFLSAPQPFPFLPRLLMDTRVYNLPTGEQIEDECRAIWINLDENEMQRFNDFIKDLEDLFTTLKPKEYGWEFLERGLAYFMKALQLTGEEQLLWHITALEALLGERGKGLTEQLTRRISMILGGTDDERDSIGKGFKKLYGFRCDLVHGNRFKNLVLVKHLTRSHIFARKTLLWFLHFLHAIQTSISEQHKTANFPSRHQLLKLLDEDNDAYQTLHWLMDKLPPEFPHVREWIE